MQTVDGSLPAIFDLARQRSLSVTSSRLELQPPPENPRSFELWLQHAAGRILFEDVRNYALERIQPEAAADVRAAAVKAIDDAVYGLMRVIDGVSGAIANDTHAVELSVTVKLRDRKAQGVIAQKDLGDGDGMCMGYHDWIDGRFGEDVVAIPK